MSQPIELAELISNLRRELDAAVSMGAESQLRFELGTIQLQLDVTVEKTGEAGGSVKFWVANLSNKAAISATTTQQLTLELTPRWADRPGRRVEVSGRSREAER